MALASQRLSRLYGTPRSSSFNIVVLSGSAIYFAIFYTELMMAVGDDSIQSICCSK